MICEVNCDFEAVKERAQEFTKELTDLCKKYGFAPELAEDDETGDKYICIDIKSLISAEDFTTTVIK